MAATVTQLPVQVRRHVDATGRMLQAEAADMTPAQRRRFIRSMTRHVASLAEGGGSR